MAPTPSYTRLQSLVLTAIGVAGWSGRAPAVADGMAADAFGLASQATAAASVTAAARMRLTPSFRQARSDLPFRCHCCDPELPYASRRPVTALIGAPYPGWCWTIQRP